MTTPPRKQSPAPPSCKPRRPRWPTHMKAVSLRLRSGNEESYYEVEVTLEDGSEVDVQLDQSFSVVGSETEAQRGPRRLARRDLQAGVDGALPGIVLPPHPQVRPAIPRKECFRAMPRTAREHQRRRAREGAGRPALTTASRPRTSAGSSRTWSRRRCRPGAPGRARDDRDGRVHRAELLSLSTG